MELGFLLKKMIGIFVLPLGIAMFILFLGLLFLYRDKIKLAKTTLTIGFIILFLFSYNPVSNVLVHSLEKQYPKLENVPNSVEYIVLLGGNFEKRAWELLRLYNQNRALKIITSGYKGHLKIADAIRSANILISLGIPKENIIIHSQPKDTKEEAKKIKKVLGKKSFILITSAYHMPRAMALFKKEGTNPIAAPANEIHKPIKFLSIPSVRNLLNTQIAIHEYLGLLWAKLRGQI